MGRYKDEDESQELKRRFAVYHDIIEESWVYQEILHKGLEKGIQQERQDRLRQQRQTIVMFVQKRFPEMLERTQKVVDHLTDPDVLEALLLKVGLAQDAQEVLSALNEVSKQEKK